MSNGYITFPCFELSQPIGTFYVGIMNSKDLVGISFADIRRPEGRDIERYIGTQRDLSEGRVDELRRYVATVDACFPTSIILAIEKKDIDVEGASNTLLIRRDEHVAKIIDGQHRIAGLQGYS